MTFYTWREMAQYEITRRTKRNFASSLQKVELSLFCVIKSRSDFPVVSVRFLWYCYNFKEIPIKARKELHTSYCNSLLVLLTRLGSKMTWQRFRLTKCLSINGHKLFYENEIICWNRINWLHHQWCRLSFSLQFYCTKLQNHFHNHCQVKWWHRYTDTENWIAVVSLLKLLWSSHDIWIWTIDYKIKKFKSKKTCKIIFKNQCWEYMPHDIFPLRVWYLCWPIGISIFQTSCTVSIFQTTCTVSIFQTFCSVSVFQTSCTVSTFRSIAYSIYISTSFTLSVFQTSCTISIFQTSSTVSIFQSSNIY